MTYPKIRTTTRRAARGGAIVGTRFVLACARAVYSGVDRRMPEARTLLAWMAESHVGLGIAEAAVPPLTHTSGCDARPVALARWRNLGSTLERAARVAERAPPALAEAWLATVADVLAFDELETALLALTLHYRLDSRLENLCDVISSSRGGPTSLRADARLLALLLGADETDVQRRLAPAGRLLASGILEIERDGCRDVLTRLSTLVARGTPAPADIRDALLGAIPATDPLPWEDFAHLGAEAETAAAVLAGALAREERGVGILLYGRPAPARPRSPPASPPASARGCARWAKPTRTATNACARCAWRSGWCATAAPRCCSTRPRTCSARTRS